MSATIVPTLVPTDNDMKHAVTNSPANNMLPGSRSSARLTVASMHPISLAELANAPAKINIHIIIIMSLLPAPRQNVSMRLLSGMSRDRAMAYTDDAMNITATGTL